MHSVIVTYNFQESIMNLKTKALSTCVVVALTSPALAEVKGELNVGVGQMSADLTATGLSLTGDLDTYGVSAIVPIADQFGLYLSYQNVDGRVSGSIAGLTAAGSLDGNSTVVAFGYQALGTMDRQNHTGADILVGLGMIASDFSLTGAGGTVSLSDETGAVFGRLEGYLAPKVRASLNFIADTDDFDPVFSVGLGYDLGAGVLRLTYAADTTSENGATLKQNGVSLGYSIEF